MFQAYPLLMRPALAPKVWGGRRILGEIHPELADAWAANAPGPEPIGEAWELADHPDGVSSVANGPLAGQLFSDLVARHPVAMTGLANPGRYPLMVKVIDAADDLSLQVHPDDALAERLGLNDRGKHEFWVAMACDAGAEVIHGLREGVDEARLRAAIASGDVDAVVQRRKMEKGLCLDLPAGTVHALLRGAMVLEIQQSSNATFRLHDWNREPARELHLEHGMAASDFAPMANNSALRAKHLPELGGAPSLRCSLASNARFEVSMIRVAPGARFTMTGGAPGCVMVCAEGRGLLASFADPPCDPIELRPGATIFLPAALRRDAMLAARVEETLTVLVARPRYGEG